MVTHVSGHGDPRGSVQASHPRQAAGRPPGKAPLVRDLDEPHPWRVRARNGPCLGATPKMIGDGRQEALLETRHIDSICTCCESAHDRWPLPREYSGVVAAIHAAM